MMGEWVAAGNNFGDLVMAWEPPGDHSFTMRFLTETYDWGYYRGRIFIADWDLDGTEVPRNWTYGA